MPRIPSIQKPIIFQASSLTDLRDFPPTAKHQAGHQLDRLQRGLEPDDWKPIQSIGPSCNEVRIHDAEGAYRVIYVAKLADAIHVLHAFQKQTHKTRKADIDLAAKRYKDLLKEHKS